MPRRTDFLIIGSGIAGLRAAADLALAGDVADPHESRSHREQHRLRAGRHCRGRRRRRLARAARGRHHRRRRRPVRRGCGRRAGRRRRALRARAVEWGARFDRDADRRVVARPRGRARPPARAARGRCDRPRDWPHAVGARGRAVAGARRAQRARPRADRARRPLHRRAIRERAIGVDEVQAGGGVARHRRRRPGVQGNDQSVDRDRRWRDAGVVCGRARRRSRVRAVSSDRARRRRARRDSCCRKRCAAKARSC